MGGIAGIYAQRFDSPVCERLTGIHINQVDDPHWLIDVLGWLAMYRQIMESQWDQADGYRAILEQKLQTEPPTFLYEFYKTFCQFLEADLKR